MSPIIKIKRGIFSKLSLLMKGELSFTTDTKQFYIGNGNSNINLTQSKNNLLTNSNFQVPVELTDNTDLENNTIPSQTGRYIFGHFYLYNDSAPIGELRTIQPITYYKPSNTNKLLRLVNPFSSPTICYYEKIPSTNAFLLEGKQAYLSFDIESSVDLQFFSGIPGNTILNSSPAGNNRICIALSLGLTTLPTKSTPSLNIILFQSANILTTPFNIGNFKLEVNPFSTPYYSNSVNEDIMLLKNCFKTYNHLLRLSYYSNNELFFYFNPSIYLMNSPPIISISSVTIYRKDKTILTGFTTSSIYDEINGYVKIICTKANHGLTDATGFFTIKIDNRP